MTSFAFMFDEVPEPVWKTSIGNWSSSSPAAMRSAAEPIRSALSESRRPSSAFTRAAAALMRPEPAGDVCAGSAHPKPGSSRPLSSSRAPRARPWRESIPARNRHRHVRLPQLGSAAGRRLAVPYLEEPRTRRSRDPAPLDRPVAEHPARVLGQIGSRGPADIATPRALAGREMAVHAVDCGTALATGETFQGAWGHDCNDRHSQLDRATLDRGTRWANAWGSSRVSPWSTSAGPSRRGSARSRCSRRSRPHPFRS